MTQRLDLAQALTQAFAHIDAGRSAEARRLARELERVRPDLPGLSYLLGLLALAEGQGKKAAQHLAKALAQTADAPPLLLAMARAQALQDRFDAAEAAYRKLTATDLVEAHAELGELLLRQGRHDEALTALRHAVELRPGAARLLNNLGVAHRALGNLAEAALCFAQAIDADAGFAKAHANLAGVLRRLKRSGEALAQARTASQLEPAEAAHWLELGQAEREAGDPIAAIAAFDQASRLSPGWAEAAWLKGETLAAAGRRDEAIVEYRRVLGLDPTDSFGASLALANLEAAAPPAEAPVAFVRALFDQYADSFEHDLVDRLHYCGPVLLSEAIGRSLGTGPFDVFDAGCGTGLLGVALRPWARRLDGVDVSPQMADKARARALYDEVLAADLVTALAARPERYDLVAAADVLIYLGDLRPVFTAAARALRPGGGLAFTVEATDGDGYRLQPSRRYAHSAEYLRRLAAETGFVVLALEDGAVRHDRGEPVPGLVAVMRKAADA